MKSLILGASSLLMLAVQVSAQTAPSLPVNVPIPPVHTNSQVTSVTQVKVTPDVSNTYTYTSKNDQSDDPMKTKTFSKSFALDRSDKVTLANIYGSITIKIWAKNEIKVDAEIKAFANTDADAQDLLDKANILASKDGDEVSFKTKIEERSGNWGSGSRNGKRWRRELKVYYTVYMPAANALNAQQQYGNLNMEDYSGPTSLKVQYGNLVAGDLKSSNNYISVQYGKATLQNVNSARIKHQYGSGITMGDANDVEIDAQYTAVDIGNVKNNVNIKHQYGRGVTIASAGSVSATVQYANIKVGKLSGTFTCKVQYGRLTVDAVEGGCKTFNADADYSSVVVGFAPSYNGEFDVNTSYGSFKYGSNVTAKRNGDDERGSSSSKSYSGQVGKGGSNRININADYNSVTFK